MNRYLVYAYDEVNFNKFQEEMTALLWACKRNKIQIAEFLIKKYSDINAENKVIIIKNILILREFNI